MTLTAIAGISLILGFSGAMMPGPLLTLIVSESARRRIKVVHNSSRVMLCLTFYPFHFLADLLWYSYTALAVSWGRSLFSDIGDHRLIGSCALFLIFFGGYFDYYGIDKFILT